MFFKSFAEVREEHHSYSDATQFSIMLPLRSCEGGSLSIAIDTQAVLSSLSWVRSSVIEKIETDSSYAKLFRTTLESFASKLEKLDPHNILDDIEGCLAKVSGCSIEDLIGYAHVQNWLITVLVETSEEVAYGQLTEVSQTGLTMRLIDMYQVSVQEQTREFDFDEVLRVDLVSQEGAMLKGFLNL